MTFTYYDKLSQQAVCSSEKHPRKKPALNTPAKHRLKKMLEACNFTENEFHYRYFLMIVTEKVRTTIS